MKIKTRKSALKRIKQKKGFFARKGAYRAHFLRKKSARGLRLLSQSVRIHSSDKKAFSRMIPYSA